jgi:hypothetical protein
MLPKSQQFDSRTSISPCFSLSKLSSPPTLAGRADHHVVVVPPLSSQLSLLIAASRQLENQLRLYTMGAQDLRDRANELLARAAAIDKAVAAIRSGAATEQDLALVATLDSTTTTTSPSIAGTAAGYAVATTVRISNEAAIMPRMVTQEDRRIDMPSVTTTTTAPLTTPPRHHYAHDSAMASNSPLMDTQDDDSEDEDAAKPAARASAASFTPSTVTAQGATKETTRPKQPVSTAVNGLEESLNANMQQRDTQNSNNTNTSGSLPLGPPPAGATTTTLHGVWSSAALPGGEKRPSGDHAATSGQPRQKYPRIEQQSAVLSALEVRQIGQDVVEQQIASDALLALAPGPSLTGLPPAGVCRDQQIASEALLTLAPGPNSVFPPPGATTDADYVLIRKESDNVFASHLHLKIFMITWDECMAGNLFISPKDVGIAPDVVTFAMAQCVPCTLTEDNRIGRYKHQELKYIGLMCRHCFGQPGYGK